MLEDENKIGETLTLKQQLFCKYFTQDHELFGNATLSYAEAYEYKLETLDKKPRREDGSKDDTEGDYEENSMIDGEFEDMPAPKKRRKSKIIPGSSDYDMAYNVCSVGASRLLRNDKVASYCEKLLNEVLKDSKVDSEMAKLILQNRDLTTKLNAIKEYNKLKQRIVEKREDKVDYSGSVIFLPVRTDKNGVVGVVKPDSAEENKESGDLPGEPKQNTAEIINNNAGGILLPARN